MCKIGVIGGLEFTRQSSSLQKTAKSDRVMKEKHLFDHLTGSEAQQR
jgi:hypothetical protein